MSEMKPIRTEQEHQECLDEIQILMAENPRAGSSKADRLELLTVLVESYENRKFPVEPPDPIDAILFRMSEKGLKQTDLVPYFGTRSRVSEVLSRKRPLTVPMIRALSIGLGISADTLVGVIASKDERQDVGEIDWAKFPVAEMVTRGWINKVSNTSDQSQLVRNFVLSLGRDFGVAAFKRSLAGEAYSPTTRHALHAWLVRVLLRARRRKNKLGIFDESTLSSDFLKELVHLSWFEEGPLLAIQYLERHGIAVIIEPHLKGTMLDGAALADTDSTPVIGLTLRHDRLDNFWFTLVHEVAHIWKHVRSSDSCFMDDLDLPSEDRREAEANRIARDALIPRLQWKRSEAYSSPNKHTIEQFAREIKVHPSIVAGRVRRETNNYSQFGDLIGSNEVRKLLTEQLSD